MRVVGASRSAGAGFFLGAALDPCQHLGFTPGHSTGTNANRRRETMGLAGHVGIDRRFAQAGQVFDGIKAQQSPRGGGCGLFGFHLNHSELMRVQWSVLSRLFARSLTGRFLARFLPIFGDHTKATGHKHPINFGPARFHKVPDNAL